MWTGALGRAARTETSAAHLTRVIFGTIDLPKAVNQCGIVDSWRQP
jgi:hypothetical protein